MLGVCPLTFSVIVNYTKQADFVPLQCVCQCLQGSIFSVETAEIVLNVWVELVLMLRGQALSSEHKRQPRLTGSTAVVKQ